MPDEQSARKAETVSWITSIRIFVWVVCLVWCGFCLLFLTKGQGRSEDVLTILAWMVGGYIACRAMDSLSRA